MKRNLLIAITLVFICACASTQRNKISLCSRELPYDPSFVTSGGKTLAECRTHMNNTTYPKIEFKDMPENEALSWIVRYSGKYSPDPPWGQSISSRYDSDDGNKTVTLSGTNLSFTEILNEICEQSNQWWGFRGSILMTIPDEDKNNFFNKRVEPTWTTPGD